jgi:coenzyme F420-reducing hydrogenase delta subunit
MFAIFIMKDTVSATVAAEENVVGIADPVIAVFECVNATRAGESPLGGGRRRPAASIFQWPIQAVQVRIPCAGRLQPEHLLKAFEEGYDAVCVITCAEDNCHCLEGSKRGHRRVDYVRGILNELGLGGDRLLLYTMPGSAREDMALGAGGNGAAATPDFSAQAQAVVEQAMSALAKLTPNPFRKNRPAVEPAEVNSAVSEEEDSD